MVTGIDNDASGDISGDFIDLTPDVHREFMLAANVPWITDEIIDAFLEYFETFTCTPDYVADADNDTVPDSEDNCPTMENLDQLDADNDSLGDVCDTLPLDFDNDGIDDAVDNCPGYYNPDRPILVITQPDQYACGRILADYRADIKAAEAHHAPNGHVRFHPDDSHYNPAINNLPVTLTAAIRAISFRLNLAICLLLLYIYLRF